MNKFPTRTIQLLVPTQGKNPFDLEIAALQKIAKLHRHVGLERIFPISKI